MKKNIFLCLFTLNALASASLLGVGNEDCINNNHKRVRQDDEINHTKLKKNAYVLIKSMINQNEGIDLKIFETDSDECFSAAILLLGKEKYQFSIQKILLDVSLDLSLAIEIRKKAAKILEESDCPANGVEHKKSAIKAYANIAKTLTTYESKKIVDHLLTNIFPNDQYKDDVYEALVDIFTITCSLEEIKRDQVMAWVKHAVDLGWDRYPSEALCFNLSRLKNIKYDEVTILSLLKNPKWSRKDKIILINKLNNLPLNVFDNEFINAINSIFPDKNYSVEECKQLIITFANLNAQDKINAAKLAIAFMNSENNIQEFCNILEIISKTNILKDRYKSEEIIRITSIDNFDSINEFDEKIVKNSIDLCIKLYLTHKNDKCKIILEKILNSTNEFLLFSTSKIINKYVFSPVPTLKNIQEDPLMKRFIDIQHDAAAKAFEILQNPKWSIDYEEEYLRDESEQIIDEKKMMDDFFSRYDNQDVVKSIEGYLQHAEAPISVAKTITALFPDKNYTPKDCINLVVTLGALDIKSQVALVYLVTTLSPNDYNPQSFCNLVIQLKPIFNVFSSSDFEKLLSLIRKNEFPENVSEAMRKNHMIDLFYLYPFFPSIRQDIYDTWDKALESPDEKLAFIVSEYIVTHYYRIGLLQENELVQKGLRVQILLSESAHPKNPYKIHRDLLQKREQLVDFSKLTLLQFFKDQNNKNGIDYKIGINPNFFNQLSKRKIDLSSVPNISPDFLENALNKIQKKISDNPRLLDEVLNVTGSKFDAIRLRTLGNVKYLPTLLTASKEHKIAGQLRCLLNHNAMLNDEDGSDNSLSTQEISLLKVLDSINNCSIGQDGGIAESYVQLPNDAKLRTVNGSRFESSTIDYVLASAPETYEYLCNILQNLVDGMFSGTNQMMREICGEELIQQSVHQALYLRNLIGDLVGSKYDVKFDISAQLYYDNLLALTRQEAAEIFYKYANAAISDFIHYVQLKINQLIICESGRTIYNEIYRLLKEDATTAFELDDKDNPFITIEGTIKLLIQIGALHQDKRLF